MRNAGKPWTRFLAVGCSHGRFADPEAIDAVLRFRDRWKPKTIVHLGDFVDTAAFRSGAKGSADEAEPVGPDIDSGLQFLRRLRPTHVLCGNHEARLWHWAQSPNAVVSYAAGQAIASITEGVAKLKARFTLYDGVYQRVTLANITFTHGTIYNEQAARDMAEMYGGRVVFAHTHKATQATGRTVKESSAYCVGTLTRMGALTYAQTRRATLSWRQGFVWGEYRGDKSACWLAARGEGEEWRLPF